MRLNKPPAKEPGLAESTETVEDADIPVKRVATGISGVLRECVLTVWDNPGQVLLISFLFPTSPLLFLTLFQRILRIAGGAAWFAASVLLFLVTVLALTLAVSATEQMVHARLRTGWIDFKLVRTLLKPIGQLLLVQLVIIGTAACALWIYAHMRPPLGPVLFAIVLYMSLAWGGVTIYLLPLIVAMVRGRLKFRGEGSTAIVIGAYRRAGLFVLAAPGYSIVMMFAVVFTGGVTAATVALLPILFGGVVNTLCALATDNQLVRYQLA